MAVRAATAMLQRAFYMLYERLDLERLFRRTEAEFVSELQQAAAARRPANCWPACSARSAHL